MTARSAPISQGLFNALPNAGPWRLPEIPAAGTPNTVGLPPELVVGSVFKTMTESDQQHFAVLPNGVAKVNDTTAAALRATNSHGLIAPPSMEPSAVARIPEQVYASPLPDTAITMMLRHDTPTLCWSWVREPGDQAPKTTVIAGRRLPLPAAALNTGIDQISGDNTVYVTGGQYVRLQAPDPAVGRACTTSIRRACATDCSTKTPPLTWD